MAASDPAFAARLSGGAAPSLALPDFTEETPPPAARRAGRRLRVGALVDLILDERAGGHVKCWERLAAVATGVADRLDLTVHFIGPAPREMSLADNVRYVIEPPVFSTARLAFLSHVPDHTDLAPWHPRLARMLPRYDVIHTTDAYFAYARTALGITRRYGLPLVNSVHTNTPEYARVFTAEIIERMLRHPAAARFLIDRVGAARYVEQRMRRRLAAHQERCAFALISRPELLPVTVARLGARAGLMRRGVDRRFFDPRKRDRPWLEATFGIPQDRLVLLYVGRLNRGKNVLLLADAMAALIEQRVPVHLVCAGHGIERETLTRRLGGHVSCPGTLAPAPLARLYASADLFTFPSEIEEWANVVHEAMAAGLPVLVAAGSGMGHVVTEGVTGLVLPPASAAPWAEAVTALAAKPERRRAMGEAARAYAETRLPSWEDVLSQDLLPRWQAAAEHAVRRADWAADAGVELDKSRPITEPQV